MNQPQPMHTAPAYQGDAMPKRAPAVVPDRLDTLDASIEGLSLALVELEARLEPVSTPMGPEAIGTPTQDGPPASAVTNRLSDMTDVVTRIRHRVEHATARLEV